MNNYDPLLMQNIMAWIGGIAAVAGLTAKVKAFLCGLFNDPRIKAVVGYIASGIVAIVVPFTYLWLTDQFHLKLALLMSISVWMTASGIYDQFHKKEE